MTSGRAHDDAPGDRAWAYRNFRILLLGQAVSSLGNTLVPVCLSFAVLALTHRASDLGAVLGCEAGAIVVFLLPAGVLADRWSRRATMVASDALRGTSQAALGLLFVTGHPPLGLVAALAAASGAGIALYYPAVSGLVPSLVGPGALQRANALQQTVVAAAGVAGPALAGVLVVGVGPGWGLVVDAGTFGVSILTLVALRLEAPPSAGSGRFAAELREGWADFWSRAWFRDVVIGASVYNFLYAGYTVLGPVVSERHYGGAAAWAAAATVTGVGSVVSAPLVARMRPRRPLVVALGVGGLEALVALAFGAHLPLAVVAVAAGVQGVSVLVFESLWQTAIQRHVPADRLSRASSYDWFGSLVAYPVGLAVAGPIADAVGAGRTLVAMGILMLLLSAGLVSLRSVRGLRDEPDAADADAVASPAA